MRGGSLAHSTLCLAESISAQRAAGGPTELNVRQNLYPICILQVSGLKLHGVSHSGTQTTRLPAAPSVCNPISPLLPSL